MRLRKDFQLQIYLYTREYLPDLRVDHMGCVFVHQCLSWHMRSGSIYSNIRLSHNHTLHIIHNTQRMLLNQQHGDKKGSGVARGMQHHVFSFDVVYHTVMYMAM